MQLFLKIHSLLLFFIIVTNQLHAQLTVAGTVFDSSKKNYLVLKLSLIFYFFSPAELVWVQEEPKNMGSWSYVKPRFDTILREGEIKRNPIRWEMCTPQINFISHICLILSILNITFIIFSSFNSFYSCFYFYLFLFFFIFFQIYWS